jgi:hypothetical protein
VTPKAFNGVYRPLVKQAWLNYCAEHQATRANDKAAYDLWYRQTLHNLTQGAAHSTAGISDRMQHHLIDSFQALVSPSDAVHISGWAAAQVVRFDELARAAYRSAQADGEPSDFSSWIDAVMRRHHRHLGDHPQAPDAYWMPDKTESFDSIMADLAVRANDEYWIKRTAEQGEIRMRWQLCRFLVDLDHVDPVHHHDWGYVVGIYRQSGMLPADIADCPAETLWRVLQMIDSHIRRLCRDLGIRPMDLPTRSTHPNEHGVAISAKAVRLHIGHELEHIADSITVPTAVDIIPF